MKTSRSLFAVLGTTLALALSFASPVLAAEEPTRAEYVAQLEQICKPRSEATARAVRGVRADVRAERLALAGRKFARARRIFGATVQAIARVPRPAADRPTLRRWFGALGSEELYLGQMVKALRRDSVAGFQRVSARFIHQGNRANNAVVSFGFNYCSFKPTRFQ
ncbi:MAG TPA: hypothetical protein VFK14_11735 [Solirubrobacterales bacterium]|nr:hypothetical protein [Solirubrobacterales bacterium]